MLTLFDVLMIVGIAASLVAVRALLFSREFRIAGKIALTVVGWTVVNLPIHSAASLLPFWL